MFFNITLYLTFGNSYRQYHQALPTKEIKNSIDIINNELRVLKIAVNIPISETRKSATSEIKATLFCK